LKTGQIFARIGEMKISEIRCKKDSFPMIGEDEYNDPKAWELVIRLPKTDAATKPIEVPPLSEELRDKISKGLSKWQKLEDMVMLTPGTYEIRPLSPTSREKRPRPPGDENNDYSSECYLVDNFLAISLDDLEELLNYPDVLPKDFREIPLLRETYDEHAKKPIKEGVVHSDSVIPPDLREALRAQVRRLDERQHPKDFHPNSKDIVQDLIHPALFPLVDKPWSEGGSYNLLNAETADPPISEPTKTDLFGRKYEDSKYQWLPCDFELDACGDARFRSQIENCWREENADLYPVLERLLSIAKPMIEQVVTYASWIAPGLDPKARQDDDSSSAPPTEIKRLPSPSNLLNQFQAIPKIVTYRLKPGQVYEGVWHVEGMSHENIIATCLYILDRSDELQGGKIKFKRTFSAHEGTNFMYEVPQVRNRAAESMITEGSQPLGTVETPGGRLCVFPNSHAHKLGRMENPASSKSDALRTIVVFFIVNPEKRIPSTADVPNQNWSANSEAISKILHKRFESCTHQDKNETAVGEILEFARWGFTLEEAKAHRLELMKERKYHKGKWNLREVELCEH